MQTKPREFIGRYRIIKILGRGAMGQVYLAHDPKIDRLVAIKTIIQDDNIPEAEAEENRQRFLREAQAAGKLLHPVIVTIFDVAEEEGEMYIAMEYIEGESLEKYCEKKDLLPYAKVVDYIRQAAEGLDYAHKYQVVHRDIKPANLMLVAGKTVKITDFGLAKNPSTSITQAGMLVGTPNYMSPEQIQGHELDGRSDLFSLGVLLYEMLTGGRPFTGKSISTVIYKILHEPAAPFDLATGGMPKSLGQVLEKALAKKTEDRYANGMEFAEALRRVLSGVSTEAEVPEIKPVAGGATLMESRKPAPPPVRPAVASVVEAGAATYTGPGRSSATGAMPALPDLRHDSGDKRVPTLSSLRPNPPSRWPYYFGGLLLAGLAGVGIFIMKGKANSGAVSAPAGRAPIPLSLTSTPPGATFTLDGKTGNPLQVEDRPGAKYILQATLLTDPLNCKRFTREITYADAAANQGIFKMELNTLSPQVSVNSAPPGAKIFVDGEDAGLLTPATLKIKDCAGHVITGEMNGQKSHPAPVSGSDPPPVTLAFIAPASAASAPVDQTAAVSTPGPVSAPASAPASVPAVVASGESGEVKVTGGNWSIAVKGRKEKFKAGEWKSLPAGKHTLQLSISDILARKDQAVEIKAGERKEISVPKPVTGTISVVSRPDGAKIYVNGLHKCDAPCDLILAVGSYNFVAQDPETREDWDGENVKISSGANPQLRFKGPQ